MVCKSTQVLWRVQLPVLSSDSSTALTPSLAKQLILWLRGACPQFSQEKVPDSYSASSRDFQSAALLNHWIEKTKLAEYGFSIFGSSFPFDTRRFHAELDLYSNSEAGSSVIGHLTGELLVHGVYINHQKIFFSDSG